MESIVDPSLLGHAAKCFPYSRVRESYMHTGNNGTTSIDGTALVSITFLDVDCLFLRLYRIRALREL